MGQLCGRRKEGGPAPAARRREGRFTDAEWAAELRLLLERPGGPPRIQRPDIAHPKGPVPDGWPEDGSRLFAMLLRRFPDAKEEVVLDAMADAKYHSGRALMLLQQRTDAAQPQPKPSPPESAADGGRAPAAAAVEEAPTAEAPEEEFG